jgi:hypothetical protein
MKFLRLLTLLYASSVFASDCLPKANLLLAPIPAGSFCDPSADLCFKNVPPDAMDDEFWRLIADPDQGNRISKQSIREVLAIKKARSLGKIPHGPIERAARGRYADFIASTGSGFDIKAKSSPRTPTGKPMNIQELVAEIQEKINRPFLNQKTNESEDIGIIIDTVWMSTADEAALRTGLQQALDGNDFARIVWLEVPETQDRFKAPGK